MSVRMFGRPDDVRYQHGAAKLQNLITMPQGPAKKRPGLKFVREVRNSANRARLLPFNFSQDDTLVIEMGRDTIDSRDIGYFRFHTNGGTVLYDLPRTYKAPATITAHAASVFTAAAHGFDDGDPIVLTMNPTTEAATFAIGDPGVVTHVGNGFVDRQQVIFQTVGGGTLPPEVEERRIYYVETVLTADTYTITATQSGNPIAFSVASTGTVNQAAMPRGSTPNQRHIRARVRYYMIAVTAGTFSVALTKEDALAGIPIIIQSEGTSDRSDIRVHYDDRIGDLVNFSDTCWYCFRRPTTGFDTDILTFDDHTGHPPSNVNFWVREVGGDNNTVTTTFGTDVVNWATHGYADGTLVVFSTSAADPPLGIDVGVPYYIRNPGTNDFQISLTLGGPIVDILDDGTGTHTALINPILEVPHFFELAEILEVDYAQSNDILTITHPNRPAMELKRMDTTHWVSEDVILNNSDRPMDVSGSAFRGDGFVVTNFTAATPTVLTTGTTVGQNGLVNGDTVYVQDIHSSVPDGFYAVTSAAALTVALEEVEDHTHVTGTIGGAPTGPNPMLWPVLVVPNTDEVYVVTAINEDGEESEPSDEFSIENFLNNRNASNTITWGSVDSATRYRVYKKDTGVFGFIGEVTADQTLELIDDNIGPDLAITPPMADNSPRRTSMVTFNDTDDRVEWAEHRLVDGDPVIFQSSGTLPTAVDDYRTYYVTDATDNSFQILAALGDAVAVALTGGDTDERHEAIGGNFPTTVAHFEQRRVFAGSLTRRQRVWMTASGTESDMSFSLPTVPSDRILFDVASLEGSAMRHVIPLGQLLILSGGTEYRVTPVNDDAITPDSISVRPQSYVGANQTLPVVVNNLAVFAANRGGHVREIGYSQDVLGYLTGDLSLRSTHLFNGETITQLAYGKAPQPIVWAVSSSGLLLGLTYVPEEQIGAWHRHSTRGTDVFESVVSVAEGTEDHAYCIVSRTINSQPVRYVERMADFEVDDLNDVFYVDAGASYDGPPATVITGLNHLDGETVAVLADGLVLPQRVVSGSTITLTTAASKVHVGLPMSVVLETLPVTLQIPAFGQGQRKDVNGVSVRVESSGPFTVGPLGGKLVPSQRPAAGALLTDSVKVTIPGSWSDHGQVELRQDDPLPLTVVSVTYDVAVGGF